MENYGLDYLNDYANNIMCSSRGLITFQNGLLTTIITMFLICSALKMFIFRHDKNKLKNNIIEFMGVLFAYYIMNSVTLIYTMYYTSEGSMDLSILIATILSAYILIIFVVYVLYIKLSPYFKTYLKPKLISLNNNAVEIFKSAMEELNSKD